jgi:hypothetical protein
MSDRDTATFATTAADVPAPEPQLREQASPIAANTVELHVGNLQREPSRASGDLEYNVLTHFSHYLHSLRP